MKNINWTGLAIVILALSLGLGWAGTMLLVAGPRTPPISDAQGQLLSALGGGIIAILAAYMGISTRRGGPHGRDRGEDDDDVDSPP
jgi:hypothetical protein